LPSDNELEKMGKAIKAIGASKLPLYKAFINEVRRILVEKGYDDAIVYSEQAYLATDQNLELVRVLTICRRPDLSPETASKVIDYLSRMQSEKS
jgi:hypothetical protein